MKTRSKLPRLVFLGLVVLVLGGIAYSATGSDSDEATSGVMPGAIEPAPDSFGGDTDAMTAVDRALGRQSDDSAQNNAGRAESDIASAPAITKEQSGASSGAVAPSAPGSSPNGAPLSTIDDRKIVQTASLKLQVKDVGAGFEDVGRIATGAGGFVASSNFSFVGDMQVANATIRVPAARYQDVLGQLRAVGAKVDGESSNASDVTEEYADLGARLRNLQATEASLLTLLGQARTINDILTVQDRLNNVQAQIEQVKGRMALLDKLGDLATISVSMRPIAAASASQPADPNSIGAKADEAWQSSLDFLGGIAGAIVTVIVFAWWLPFVAVPLLIAGRWLNHRPRSVSAVD